MGLLTGKGKKAFNVNIQGKESTYDTEIDDEYDSEAGNDKLKQKIDKEIESM